MAYFPTVRSFSPTASRLQAIGPCLVLVLENSVFDIGTQVHVGNPLPLGPRFDFIALALSAIRSERVTFSDYKHTDLEIQTRAAASLESVFALPFSLCYLPFCKLYAAYLVITEKSFGQKLLRCSQAFGCDGSNILKCFWRSSAICPGTIRPCSSGTGNNLGKTPVTDTNKIAMETIPRKKRVNAAGPFVVRGSCPPLSGCP